MRGCWFVLVGGGFLFFVGVSRLCARGGVPDGGAAPVGAWWYSGAVAQWALGAAVCARMAERASCLLNHPRPFLTQVGLRWFAWQPGLQWVNDTGVGRGLTLSSRLFTPPSGLSTPHIS